MRNVRHVTLAAWLLLLFGCAQPEPAPTAPAPVADLKAQVAAKNAVWADAADRGDVKTLASLYTDTATMLPPGTAMVRGKPGIEQALTKMGKAGLRHFALTTVDLAQVGPDTAYEIGTFHVEARGPKKRWLPVDGKYVTVWKLMGADWLLNVDIWNMNK